MDENQYKAPAATLKLAIRDLLWLTVVVAIGLGWWLESRKPTPSAALPPQVGRWQLSTNGDRDDVMVDTVTGECWYFRKSEGTWYKRPSLPKK
jgi:hypothetical protein